MIVRGRKTSEGGGGEIKLFLSGSAMGIALTRVVSRRGRGNNNYYFENILMF